MRVFTKQTATTTNPLNRTWLHLIILIGVTLGIGEMSVWGQAQGELMMKKTWDATPGSGGHEGTITLETFVTGSEITYSTHQPNDIVLVLDFSNSMASSMSILREAVGTFCDMILQDAVENDVDHRISICSFAAGPGTYGSSSSNYDGTQLLSGSLSTTYYPSYTDADYNSSLLSIKSNGGNTLNNDVQSAINKIKYGNTSAGTYMQYGLDMALNVLNNRSVKTFTSDGREFPRGMIVVFFTDGAPGYGPSSEYWRNNSSTEEVEEADAAVAKAAAIKAIRVDKHDAESDEKPRVYSIGILDNANNSSAYICDKEIKTGYSRWKGREQSGPSSQAYACINGLLHFISSDFDETIDSWQPAIEIYGDLEVPDYDGFYFGSSEMNELQSAFAHIASQSGATPVDMNSATIIQDVISESFKLPANTQVSDIKVYAPKLTGIEDVPNPTRDDYYFEDLEEGLLTIGKDDEGNIGVITGGTNNRLPTSYAYTNDNGETVTVKVIDIQGNDNKTIQITGFNFKQNWCGKTGNIFRGRKIVIKIPIETEEGVWGDGIETNGPMSVIFPNGDMANPIGFERPTADVKGDVWTEIVTSKPNTFNENADPIPLGSPEDLAWFISWVNGREGYGPDANGNPTDGIVPHPSANAILTADLDMSAHNWVPIGGNSVTYTGTFDGDGHVITGLKNNASKFYKQGQNVVVYPGMFGTVGGTVHDVFVLDCEFRAKKHEGTLIHYGIIIDTLAQGGTLYNSEAAGRLMTDNGAGNETLIFGGLVGLNHGTIHSCMSMAQLTGFNLGGAIGESRWLDGSTKISVENIFTNPQFNYIGAHQQGMVGGFTALSEGTNYRYGYMRFERPNQGLEKAYFGMALGHYICVQTAGVFYQILFPIQSIVDVPYEYWGLRTGLSGGIQATHYANTMPKYLYNYKSADDVEWMLEKLNHSTSSHSKWKRTTAGSYSLGAGDINDDYPILSFGYACIGSADGIAFDYSHSLNEMLDRHNSGKLNENTALPGEGSGYVGTSTHDYHVNASPSIYGGTINLYKNDHTDRSTNSNVMVYIDENISLLQDAGSVIEAYTCQTMKTFCDSDGERWHNVSSSLANSEIGFSYIHNDTVPHNWEADPCGVQLSENDDKALFPSDASSVTPFDFYCFYEPQYHWINFRRNSKSHWHMDNYTLNIPYDNETTLTPGKGYLLAIDKEQFLQNRGMLNNGTITIPVTTSAPDWTGLKGYNLLGNPYQSYLDFTIFAWANSGLWKDASEMTYAVYDPQTGDYVQGTAGEQPSEGALAANGDINMHQGFFVKVSTSGTATFTNDMRSNTPASGTQFRGSKANYPLVNLILTDAEGKRDIAVLEVGRPENGGGQKLRTSSAKGHISLRHDDKDFGILFSEKTEGSQPLYFDTDEDGTFTLSWNTANADFSSLTLVDNLTGVKYDMLANDHYTFQGNASDYRSRFKVVIGRFTGIDEEDGPSTGSGTFAFYDGSDWVVNGQGQLTVTDMTGRTVYATSLTNDQNRVSLNGVANGVYLMRVADGQNVMVQKIVVR